MVSVCELLQQGVLAAANFERRSGDAAAASTVFDQALEQLRSKQSSDSSSSGSSAGSDELGFLYLMYANFTRQVRQHTAGRAMRSRQKCVQYMKYDVMNHGFHAAM